MTKLPIPDLLRVEPGTRPKLGKIDPASTPGFPGDEAAAEDRFTELLDELAEFQERLWAEAGQSLLVVLQALDAGGKDGLIRKVISAFNPQGTRATGFGVPSEEALRHDFLWRVQLVVTPGKGRIGVFNRSHYEDVLVVRVNDLVPKSVWKERYDQINGFEATLAASDTTAREAASCTSVARSSASDSRSAWRIRRSSGSGHRRNSSRPARSGRTTAPPTPMRWRAAPPITRPGSSSRPTTSGIATSPQPRSSSRPPVG